MPRKFFDAVDIVTGLGDTADVMESAEQPGEPDDHAEHAHQAGPGEAEHRGHWVLLLVGTLVLAIVAAFLVSQPWGGTDDGGQSASVEITVSSSGDPVESPHVETALPDSDGDEIPDEVESAGWATDDGMVYRTDPHSADTDGDGLTDAEEAGSLLADGGSRWLYAGVSSPTEVDSDGDGLDDFTEVRGWQTRAVGFFRTDPVNRDTDADGLSDREEAGALISDSGQVPVYAGVSDPTKVDSDGDGLGDRTEVKGWKTSRSDFYQTDPLRADTDGDGLTDAEEAQTLPSVDGPGEVHSGFSNPLVIDSDGDGLSDAEEADLSLNPFNLDTDGDGLSDGREAHELGTAPDLADTDGDEFDDGDEDRNRYSHGLDPLVFDVKIGKWDYALDFATGAVLGDLRRVDSVPWLVGNLASGGASFIPGIGWIVGSVADIRDAVGSGIRADWVGAGLSAVGLVPDIGDAVAIPGKAAKFISRAPELGPAVGATIVALKKVPDQIKIETSKKVWRQWDYVAQAGINEKALLRLQQSQTNIDGLAAAIGRPGHVNGSATRFMKDWQAGEKYLEEYLRKKATLVDTQMSASTAECVRVCNPIRRRFDVVADGIAHESKVGRVIWSAGIESQIRSDAYLIGKGVIKGSHWHFFPSDTSNSLGADVSVLDLLEKLSIPYTIHLPSRG